MAHLYESVTVGVHLCDSVYCMSTYVSLFSCEYICKSVAAYVHPYVYSCMSTFV